ncbi:hypothetical protein AAHA92_29999 [Salvia divinorum]|uniref:Uncharacterized protein n=1 Tax=Salvia divinorum TaxID=28513 RepID=A0ABD1G367_SALDI
MTNLNSIGGAERSENATRIFSASYDFVFFLARSLIHRESTLQGEVANPSPPHERRLSLRYLNAPTNLFNFVLWSIQVKALHCVCCPDWNT